MASRHRFVRGLSVRLAALFVAVSAAALAARPGTISVALVAAAIGVLVAIDLNRYVQRTNRELARFVGALRFSDTAQSFPPRKLGSGFEDLSNAFQDAMERLRASRAIVEEEVRYLRTLVDHAPSPLLAAHPDGRVDFLNHSARRLLGAASVQPDAVNAQIERFWQDIRRAQPGSRWVAEIDLHGSKQSIALAVSQIATSSGVQRIISLQSIQNEVETAELGVWRDLVRVLSHEIMNSITPLTSLAHTASAVLADAIVSEGRLADAKVAVETIARRADRLKHFVQSYRELTRLPPPRRRAVALKPFLSDIARLFCANSPGRDIALQVSIDPESLELNADPEQMEQAVLNLLRNAAEAARGAAGSEGRVWVSALIDPYGRVTIEVSDNGTGVPPDIRDSIFLPFFTTKPSGTGVGLSLTRQIALSHHASLSVGDREGGGAVFRLLF